VIKRCRFPPSLIEETEKHSFCGWGPGADELAKKTLTYPNYDLTTKTSNPKLPISF